MICCEYTHAMGNSCGAMSKYTDYSDEEKLYQGGFIWDYIDQCLEKKNYNGDTFMAYGGDFDDRPNDGDFSGNGIVYGNSRKPSPKMPSVKYNYRPIKIEITADSISIYNRMLDTNTSEFEAIIKVNKDGKALYQMNFETEVGPLSTRTYANPVKREQHSGEYTITLSYFLKKDMSWAKAGHEIAFEQFVYQVKGKSEIKIYEQPQVVMGEYNIGVYGEHFKVLFSKMYGGLVSYQYAGKEYLKDKVLANFWRAPIPNDRGNKFAVRSGQWKLASMYQNATGNGFNRTKEGLSVWFTYEMPTIPVSTYKITYVVRGDGQVSVSLMMNPIIELGDIPEYGVLFTLPKELQKVTWYGLGEQETYSDRKEGAKLGIYSNHLQDNLAEYLVPQECGNKEEVRYATITDDKNHGLIFYGNPTMNFSALPYTPHELENAKHAFELPGAYKTVVRIAFAQMGVGGDDSWGAKVHPEYLIDTRKKLEFTFSFKGI